MIEREKYITELASYLGPLTADEREDALDFYNGFIADGDLSTRAAIEAKLGTPKQLSRKILADFSIKANDQASQAGRPASTHSSWRVFWWVLVAIITSPLTFGIGLAAVAGLVALAGCLLGLVVGAVGVIAALAVAAAGTLYAGIGLIVTAPMVGIFYAGIGLSLVGGFMILVPLLYWLIRLVAQAIANFAKLIYQKIQTRRGGE